MKIKDFKKQIRNEELIVPDLKEKIKNTEIFKNREIEEKVSIPLIRNRNWFRFSLSALIIILVAIFTIVMIGSGNDENHNYQASNVKYVKNKEDLSELLNYQKKDSFGLMYDVEIFNGNILYSKGEMVDDATFELPPTIAEETTGTSTKSEVSETNKQVDNVDESDIVKCDGKKIYRIHNNYLLVNKINSGTISDTEKIDLTLEEKEKIDTKDQVENNEYTVYVSNAELYLTDDYVVTVYETGLCYTYNYYIYPYYNYYRTLHVKIYDKETLDVKKDYCAQITSYNQSRIVNGETDVLYFIFNQAAIEENELKPCYELDKATYKVDYTSICYYDNFRYQNYTYIVSIKLDDDLETNTNVTLGSSYWDNIYVNENRIYLEEEYTESYYNFLKGDFYGWKSVTSIASYSINNGDIQAEASLSTEGSIISQFAMDEYNGYFRVVLSIVNNNKLEVYKLEENTDGKKNYVLVGKITEGLGEANEEVKSVNFNKDECLVVTAKQTDPMYKIDLTDPANPKILGKFKEDGYNSYLQYLKGDLEGLAIGIGYITTDISDTYNIRQCAKFGLYDVTGDNPEQLKLITYNGDVNACYNHKALFVYKNYVGFSEGNQYHLYEIVKEDNTYTLVERINLVFKNLNVNDYYYSNARMYYVDGYFYIANIEYNGTSKLYSYDANYSLLKEIE